jgi:cell fate regulator YaaT (PSP1 superfamily)
MTQITLVGISFHAAGKIFDFDARDFELLPGDQVIVETERGRSLGTVVTSPRLVAADEAPPKLKTIMRPATASDLQMAASNQERGNEALHYCRQRVQERGMEMKLVQAEHLFDGSKIIFYFTADGRVDFRELVRDLAQHFRTRIEMRQIGVRDEAKLVGGLGICGRELCCCSHLRDFAPVSVKMAKAQGLALNPAKISGQCGRLLCCLAYEYDNYRTLVKNLPKCGKKLQLGGCCTEVIAQDILAQKVTLVGSDGERRQVHIDQLQQEMHEAGTPAEDPVQKKPQERGRQKHQPRKTKQQAKESQQPEKGRNAKEAKSAAKENETDSEGARKKSTRRRRRPRRRNKKSNPDKPS